MTGNRDKRIIVYVSDSDRRTIKSQAVKEDISMSDLLRDAAFERIERDKIEGSAEHFEVEERILDLVDESAERAAEKIVEELERDGELEQNENPFANWGDDR